MVKQTKKGSIGKKALSAILAASMIMTSSSFVMAAPVVEEVEPVAVVEEVAAQAEEVDVEDENAGVSVSEADVTIADLTYNGADQTPVVTIAGLKAGEDYSVTYDGQTTVKDAKTYTAIITLENGNAAADGSKTIKKEVKVNKFVINDSNVTADYTQAGYVYSGNVQKPIVKYNVVAGADVPADFDEDNMFELVALDSSYDLTSAGSQKVKAVLKDDASKVNYELADGFGTHEYTITKKMNEDGIDVDGGEGLYTGNPVAATPTVTIGGKVQDPSSYTITYGRMENGKLVYTNTPFTNVNESGKPYPICVTFNGNGNVAAGVAVTGGEYSIRVTNFGDMLNNAVIAGATQDEVNKKAYHIVYDGAAHTIKASDISIPGLTQGVDYKVEVDTNSIKGVADKEVSVKITGINNYSSTPETLTVDIIAKEINTTEFTISAQASKDVASEDEMVVTVKYGDIELEEGTDYTFILNKDDKTILLNGGSNGNYVTAGNKGIAISYTESAKKLLNVDIVDIQDVASNYYYTGKQITPAVKVYYDNTPLVVNKDYTVSYGANIDKEGSVTITGIGDYEGSKTEKFDIVGNKDITDYTAYLPKSAVNWEEAKAGNGKLIPVVVYSNGAPAPASVTYEVKYFSDKNRTKDITSDADFNAYVNSLTEEDFDKKNNVIYVSVVGTGDYKGSIVETALNDAIKDVNDGDLAFEIKKSEIIASVDDIADQEYTGEVIEPAVVVKNVAGDALTKDTDYTVSYSNNIKCGVAYVTVTGKGNYTGTIIKAFNIVGEMDQEIEVLPAQVRDLKTRTLNSKATKIKFKKAPETTVTYTSSDEDVVTVDANGNLKYTGLGKATITIKAAAEDSYKEAIAELEIGVGLETPTFTPSSLNDAFRVTTSTVKGAKKFQVQYVPTGKAFTSAAAKTKTFTVDKKLIKGKIAAGNKKTYRIRVRAINGTTKSKWSTVKTVATK